MDSRFNLGEGFSIPQENEFSFVNSWMPVTSEKPVPTRSNSMPIERHESQLGRGNWQQQLAGIPSGYVQEVSNYSRVAQHLGQIGQLGRNGSLPERNRMINQIAGSYTQALQNESEIWSSNCSFTDLLAMKNIAVPHAFPNRTLNTSVSMAERTLIPNSHPQFNGLRASSSGELLFGNPTPHSSSNLLSGHQSLCQLPEYGFPIPHHPNYDLNSLPSKEAQVASTVGNSVQFTPVTPQPANKLEKELSATVNFPRGKGLSEETEKQRDFVVSIDISKENSSNELIHNVLDSSSAVISTPFEEPRDSGKGSDQAIDLNQTPQQKPPKRKKHRPKVIKEGRPSITPKAATKKTAESKERTTEKRKYVRKKDQQESATPQPDSLGEIDSMEKPKEKRRYVRKKSLKEPATQNGDCTSGTTYPSSGTAAPSCRRALNFDSLQNTRYERESNSDAQPEILNKEKETSNWSTGFQVAESINQTNMMCRTKSDLQMSQQSELLLENQQSRAISNLALSMKKLPDNISISNRREPGPCYISNSDTRAAAAQLASTKDVHLISLEANSRDTNIRMQQHIHALGLGQIAFTEKLNYRNIQNSRQMMPQNTQLIPETSLHLTESRGYKRQYCHVVQTSNCATSPPGKLLCQEIPHTHSHLYDHMSRIDYSETHKKKKLQNGIQTNTNCMLPPVAAVNQSRSRISSINVNSVASTSQTNGEILNSYFESNYIKRRENNGSNILADWYAHLKASRQDVSKQHMLSGQNLYIERIEESNRSNKVPNPASLITMENYNILPPTPPKTHPQPGNQLQPKMCNIDSSRKQEDFHSRNGRMLQEQIGILKDLQSPTKRKGRPVKQKLPATFEEIIYQMQGLTLNERSNEMKGEEQNALVLYKGDGTLIPYQGSKKRKPRPKVDLDPETERVWKLLMWKEGSEGLGGTDEEKQKWWEEERRVFRGRADSFIARMHLVQGDRRFSKWKGSVVDSVIGVFLTQNVSDHLSSSAFMALAARFPLKSTRNRTNERDGPIILVEEPDDCMLNPSDTIKWHEKLFRHPFYNQTSMTVYESIERRVDHETSWTGKTSTVDADNHSPEEEVLSSQDSVDSSVIQNYGVRSYSGSNSEAEDPANGRKHHKNLSTSSSDLLQVGSTTLFEEFYSHVSGRSLSHERTQHVYKQTEDTENRQQWPRLERLDDSVKGPSTFNQQLNYNNPQMQVPAVLSSNYRLQTTAQSEVVEVESFELYGEESISSWPSSASKFSKQKDASCTSKMVVQGTETVAKTTIQQNASARYQETRIANPHPFLSKQMMCERSNPEPYHGQLDNKSTAEPANLADLQANMQRNYKQHVSNIAELTGKVFDVEERAALVDKQNLKEQVNRITKENLSANSLKARKEKAEGQKKDAVDWESLRKQALANGKRKERSLDTMDSMDYETMRCSSVKEISETIKERGMNNMLAERIQEFLNRMVQEHGSIDLEWLRDVPPEKAKEYLLSIRGLGLKSVECVRLLTLHHLAFPVDTNVGRIAVRLGWVPLQPLPESLQLHLLELYPVLESIQKYLWPRLCKLDQRTLYELHYQLITFGKVFCTKSRPNCNACPMRAECRHFASAFASARLALPGPEEKSMVPSTVPITMERIPGIVINPMPLPSPEENSLKRGGSGIVSSVPIIEEPATPEQHIEVIESDIEELFDEDPDEIPTIKLNMEELSVTVQNYMQANMELQEGDMSKALVALNPKAASIPTPKLKNISRLRTEHQVYELPDSHPLLKGMDKREPDDPSPYLLAIWTPGETANSIQPPDQHCQSQEPNKLCNDETCFSCNSVREANSQIVRGTLLIPCRTAMRGSFPLNGTYFQVNEVFADHESSLNPIDVPRAWIWNLPRRIVYFGTSVSTIFKGLSTEGIQYCFWKGFVCVRGFDQKTRAPRPLLARLHFPASKLMKTRNQRQ